MAATTYTVVKGDTLSEIAYKYYKTYGYSSWTSYQAQLVKLNNISDPDYIVVGQVLKLTGTSDPVKKNTTSKATIKLFGLQSDTDRTMYATWTWDKANTDSYQVKWYYDTGNGIWFEGSDSTVKIKQSLYTAPSNALRVKFKVKPISKTRTVNKKETTYWTAAWSTEKTYSFADNPPDTPPVPSVKIRAVNYAASSNSNLRLAYYIDSELESVYWGNDKNISYQFQIIRDDTKVIHDQKYSKSNNSAYSTVKMTYQVDVGHKYKARCRTVKKISSGKYLYSDWSDYSASVNSACPTPDGFVDYYAHSDTMVYLEWNPVTTAVKYEIQYTTNKEYFDVSSETSSTSTSEETKETKYFVSGLESGNTYFFRIRAINEDGEASGWSTIISIAVGKTPIEPTTWSSRTTVETGEDVSLHWIHNVEDGSKQTSAEIELTINGFVSIIDDINTEDSYSIDTNAYPEGAVIRWRVRTAGVTNNLSDWSIQRTITIYAPLELEFVIQDSQGEYVDELTSFPLYISAEAGPDSQTPLGYHVTISANSAYETVDDYGGTKLVNAGESIYSEYFDASSYLFGLGEAYNPHSMLLELSAGDINLDNNIEYTVTVELAMNSGLTKSVSKTFVVAWTDEEYEPNAEIGYDESTYTTTIRPYCEDENGEPIADVLLSVYRREFDGTFTELCRNLENTDGTFITDPHPALDYARYRVVATDKTTGSISYYDVPAYPIGEKAILIQWDEDWMTLDEYNEDASEQPVWSGSLLRLPYNIDVSDSYSKDVEHIEYIGRKHPVSYYGTHVGQTSSWSTEIPKDDVETLYALRRLSVWNGDVYVREPSGSGYWASISVSFSQTHCELTIPVSLDITRVEGGA